MRSKEPGPELDARSGDVLKELIREFVSTCKPVGSRRLAQRHSEHLSSATIRNMVADLEDQGFVCKPHTSAGRVPTAKGYRFFVDSLTKFRRPTTRQVDRILQVLGEEADPDALMEKTSQVLSQFSQNVGFVLPPPMAQAVMKHIEFVKISRARILVILVSQTGLVQHRIIRFDEELRQADLDEAGRYLVRHFGGKTLIEVREELLQLMSQEQALYNRLLHNAVTLGAAGLFENDAEEEGETAVYLGGTSTLMEKPELADVNLMGALFHTFEEKGRLVRILSRCLEREGPGPTVTIGLQSHIPEMRDFSLVASNYSCRGGARGTLGILGPSRMEYEKAIGLVNCVARLFERQLDDQRRNRTA